MIRKSYLTTSMVAALCCAFATSRALATNFPEAEANDTKAAANAFTMVAGDTITGTTTGTSTTVAGNGSADYFRVKTGADALAIYEYTMTMTSAAAGTGHSATLRGLSQSGGVIGTTDNSFQSHFLSGANRINKWYGFGKQEEVYYRVTGISTSTQVYTATLSRATIASIAISGTLEEGNITIARTAPNVIDSDFWVYDSNFDPIANYGNDDPNTLTRSYTPGTYYLAVSNFNTANNQAAATGDTSTSATVLDFPNAVANSSSTTATTTTSNLNFTWTDTAGHARTGTSNKTSQFQVVFYQFVVIAATNRACCLPDGTCQDITGPACATAGGVPGADGSTCGSTICPQACCGLNGGCTLVLPAACASAGGLSQGTGVSCASNPCNTNAGRCCFNNGTCSLQANAGDCTTAGGFWGGAGTNCAPSPGAGQTFTGATGLPLAVPDNVAADVTSTITVVPSFTIADANVYVKTTHTWTSDLTIKVTHPDLTTTSTLWLNQCSSNDNINVTFDDEGVTVVCALDTIGTYKPNTVLSVFDGLNSAGVWTLKARDTASGDVGSVLDWNITLSPTLSPCAGACCNGLVCTRLSRDDCTLAGGVYNGDGVSCTPTPCQPTGACCLASGSCIVDTATNCATAGGIYTADGQSCGATQCTGACCLAAPPFCSFGSQQACTTAGGSYQGGGSSCIQGAANTYSSTDTPIIIVDNPGATAPSVITVGASYVIGDVNVAVDIQHTFLADIDMSLSHGATTMFLWQDACSSNDNLNVTFDDSGAAVTCAQPTVGTIRPNSAGGGLLSAFIGSNVNGTWTLQIVDDLGGDSGTINSWSLIVGEMLTACQPTTGACCVAGVCSQQTATDCATNGGTFFGVGSQCTPDPCPQACCFPNGSCSDLNPAACTAAGGTSQGVGTDCDPNPCTAVPGADCAVAIAFDVPGSLPYSDANTTVGKGNDYSTTCLGTGDSGQDVIYELLVTEDLCVTISLTGAGASWGLALDDACPPDATCIATDTVTPYTLGNTVLTAGTYYIMVDNGTGVAGAYTLHVDPCPPVACCFNDGHCEDLDAYNCGVAGGAAQATGTVCSSFTCPAPQRCCNTDGSCTVVLASLCTAGGGTPGGIGTDCTTNVCPPFGACCLCDGTCIQGLNLTQCTAASGTWQGANSSCVTGAGSPITYSDNGIDDAGIEDSTINTANDVITVAEATDYLIADVNVVVNITHTWLFDLDITVTHTNSCLVFTNACSACDNMAVTFDDEGVTLVCGNPTTGTYKPNGGVLSTFDGLYVNGTWTISIDDGAGGDTGTLNSWSIIVTPGTPTCPQTEACCFTDGTCQELTAACCNTAGGTPQGASTDCTPNNCPPPIQACCLRNGTCQDLLPAACLAIALPSDPTPGFGPGVPQGPGTTCGTTVCSAVCLLGDANCDGLVNNFDIDPFVQGLLNSNAGYLATGSTQACFDIRACWGDVDHSTLFNNFDIDPFVACLLAPPPPLNPCP